MIKEQLKCAHSPSTNKKSTLIFNKS